MPQASEELRARWGVDLERALAVLVPERFVVDERGYIHVRECALPLTEEEDSAIDFLCQEWDYAQATEYVS